MHRPVAKDRPCIKCHDNIGMHIALCVPQEDQNQFQYSKYKHGNYHFTGNHSHGLWNQ